MEKLLVPKRVNSREVESFFDTIMKYRKGPGEGGARMSRVVKAACPELFNRPDTRKEARLCDVGCGDGHVLRELQRSSPGLHLEGVDISGKMISHCKENSTGITYHHLDISPIEFHNSCPMERLKYEVQNECKPELNPESALSWGTFDYVLSLNTMFLMPDVYQAMGQHVRLMSEGGKLVLCQVVFTESKSTYDELKAYQHVGNFVQEYLSTHTWKSIIRRAGLHIDDVSIKLIDDIEFLVITASLKPVAPVPTISDTLGVKFPSDKPPLIPLTM
eukprot:TRINITY_DN3566_c1_g1_i1.p1 TRINITY_DN3566_c1_g1~~TRINITY_DN3566_c1_g1_i1.p1  ORF type:complete len:275 (+),score=27.97 TRINITY_DN3566_c1_g1_i1:95-919(+)